MELQAALLVVLVVLGAYMPVLLTLYVCRRRQAHVRCRQPLAMAFAAACVMIFALADPMHQVVSGPTKGLPCYWHVVWATFGVTGSAWYLIVAASHVVQHRVTEVLAQPLDLEEPYPKMRLYRWMLRRRVQRCACAAIVALILGATLSASNTATLLGSSTDGCLTPAMVVSIGIQFGFCLCVVLSVVYALHSVDDLAGLHRTYAQTLLHAMGVLWLLGFVSYCESQFQWTLLRLYNVKTMVSTLLAHLLFYFNIVHPMTSLRATRVDDANYSGDATATSCSLHELASFRTYLEQPHGLDDFTAYCRLALRLEDILAYTTLWNFMTQPPTREAATAIYHECLDHDGPLVTPSAAKWRDFYWSQLAPHGLWNSGSTRNVHGLEVVPWDLYSPFLNDLVVAMYRDLAPDFTRHALGLSWREFRYEHLHASQRCISGGPSLAAIVSMPLGPIPASSTSSRFHDDEP
ncbi:hypothetical protein SPRG_17658 [Saprolegnia parasitica CBS 223.65]|uniref:RGS domain-containing protein n=1 Tax=Saprolegnia parasitica (strain CBS 223.65) TaxID=695850 RepID=A0A067BQA9_SAPPC|nr:hypothetical protein SPRG_17658 [Saprolegnia parasitica CBS 223.65]KDO16862.1 hypothetical protein SPRG_17658 [Saprolegnia parasitica CBS 223.65]|eukprot:XP_012212432.1 hypothetical protein SPRG_17658 [Saprolegnia parasitica CBS 223.65]